MQTPVSTVLATMSDSPRVSRKAVKEKPLGSEFLIAGLAGIGTGFFTNPADLLKTRLQLQGELAAPGTYRRVYRNTFHAACTIARSEGILALQSGLAPALGLQIIINSLSLGSYHYAKRLGLTTNEGGDTNVLKTVLVTGTASACSVVIGSPFSLAKVKLQARPIEIGIGVGALNTRTILRSAWQESGFKGLYRGWYANVPRISIGSAIQLSTFGLVTDFLKTFDQLKDRPILRTILASTVSGAVVIVSVHPLDITSTRLYNQGINRGQGALYNGICDAMIKICRVEGAQGLFKGLFPHWLRIAPYIVISQTLYEQISLAYDDYVMGWAT